MTEAPGHGAAPSLVRPGEGAFARVITWGASHSEGRQVDQPDRQRHASRSCGPPVRQRAHAARRTGPIDPQQAHRANTGATGRPAGWSENTVSIGVDE